MSRSSLALNSLRAFVILIARSFRAVLAHLGSWPVSAFSLASLPDQWRALPIVFSASVENHRARPEFWSG
jgi:hypothetical protein